MNIGLLQPTMSISERNVFAQGKVKGSPKSLELILRSTSISVQYFMSIVLKVRCHEKFCYWTEGVLSALSKPKPIICTGKKYMAHIQLALCRGQETLFFSPQCSNMIYSYFLVVGSAPPSSSLENVFKKLITRVLA